MENTRDISGSCSFNIHSICLEDHPRNQNWLISGVSSNSKSKPLTRGCPSGKLTKSIGKPQENHRKLGFHWEASKVKGILASRKKGMRVQAREKFMGQVLVNIVYQQASYLMVKCHSQVGYTPGLVSGISRWCPQDSVQLVNITLISLGLMVDISTVSGIIN